ncbi:hypothetical protein FV232_06970 [Methylobacterium sp. WL30]|uniref:hypothetical protein n=1 Tax=unclassified Methylobacterium TaxID=2615210 RepID=UPI0011CAFE85|nr:MULTISPECIES: hypothetical protein [unclassified Methylobacterium]TXN40437.1 hypothetical protein FV225_06135 [Methylobacterium sp. WL93]TXN49146.1 hypothetical protein FV227_17860 [Methylobacterium sp. WL119]TXN68973.1 hypothetical protein FV232_06970 [Methylobacterium sp. WL30]
MNIDITAPADPHALQRGPVTVAIAAMRDADPERSALQTLRASLLSRIADDLAQLERLQDIGDRLEVGGQA